MKAIEYFKINYFS